PENSKTLITTGSVGYNLFLGPDYRIYFFLQNSTYFSGCIHCPNEIGVACGVDYQQISLGGRSSGNDFTNIPANLLYDNSVNCVAEVNDMDLNSFSIFPNPTSDRIFISGENNIKHVEIYSISGQILKTQD